jgi:predicted RNA methylase
MARISQPYFAMTDHVFDCMIDTERTHAFAKAIAETVQRGDVVVDMGAGSGVLAMLAARAGAKTVYAVELDRNNIATLGAVFRANNLADKIVLVQGDVRTAALPEKVDVIIGEMIATALIEELQVPAMNHMLRFAKPNARVLLSHYRTFVDLVDNPASYYGFDFRIIRYEYPDLRHLRSRTLSDKQLILDVDFNQPVTQTKVNQRLCLTASRRGRINGLRLSSETAFWDGSTLGATYAYSYPIILPIDTIEVGEGNAFDVEISYKICGGMQTLKYAVEKMGRT